MALQKRAPDATHAGFCRRRPAHVIRNPCIKAIFVYVGFSRPSRTSPSTESVIEASIRFRRDSGSRLEYSSRISANVVPMNDLQLGSYCTNIWAYLVGGCGSSGARKY